MKKDDEDRAFALGAIVLASFAGMAIGLLFAVGALRFFDAEIEIARFIFGGGLAAAVVGAIYPRAALDFVEMTVHFFIGLLSASADHPGTPNDNAPEYLKAALLFGVLLAIALLVLSNL